MTSRLNDFSREMNEFSIAMGLPPSVAKVLTYLTVCQPSLQTAASIRDQTGISAGSVSEALTMLRQIELIERQKLQGQRHYSYEITPDGWKKATAHRFRMLEAGIRLADKGLAIDPDNERLRSMRDMYVLFNREFANFYEKFQ